VALRTLPVLYPIIDSALCTARHLDPVELAATWLRAGVRLVQLRVKQGPDRAFLELSDAIAALAHESNARLIVNDRSDIALMSGADGVHVGQDDLPVDDVRALLGTAGTIGVSSHDSKQVDSALASSADYVAVGPVFGTTTKDTGYEARGLDLVRYAAGRGKPVVGIGGITLETAPDVIAAGARAVAVISDLLVGSAEERVREYLRALG
jgi:thiamine-phosphate pyrophosphorylase